MAIVFFVAPLIYADILGPSSEWEFMSFKLSDNRTGFNSKVSVGIYFVVDIEACTEKASQASFAP